jgi:hypothetical protein
MSDFAWGKGKPIASRPPVNASLGRQRSDGRFEDSGLKRRTRAIGFGARVKGGWVIGHRARLSSKPNPDLVGGAYQQDVAGCSPEGKPAFLSV